MSQQALREPCGDPEKGITAWPIASIEQAVQPTPDQRALLDELKSADAKARQKAVKALGHVGTDAAVPILVSTAQRKKFLGGKKLRALKERSVDALARVGTAKAAAALKDAAATGDATLRKLAAQRVRG